MSFSRSTRKRTGKLFLQGTDSRPSVCQVGLLCAFQFMAHFEKRDGLFYKVGNTTDKEYIRPGHYNEDGIVKRLEKAFSDNPLLISTHTPTHTLTIQKNKNAAGFWVDEDLTNVLDIRPK